jgi:hypothetical protein
LAQPGFTGRPRNPERSAIYDTGGSVLSPSQYKLNGSGNSAEIKEDYDRLHLTASSDIQRARHEAEGTRVSLPKSWLPSAYEVAMRNIASEIESDEFETGIQL